MTKFLMAATAAVLTSCAAMPIMAEGVELFCAHHTDLSIVLQEEYEEKPHVMGISSAGFIIEMWGNEKTGTFTLVETSIFGEACIIAEGIGFLRNPLPNA